LDRAEAAMDKKDHLIKDSMIFFVASSTVNLANFIFHSIASRKLGPENYGVLVTLLAMIMIVTMPAVALQITIVKKVSVFKARNKPGNILHLFKKTLKWFSALGAAYLVGFVVAAPMIEKFFRVWDRGLIVILGFIAVISLLVIIVRGMLQGLQDFSGLGFNTILDAGLRLATLFIFTALGWGVRGALSTTLAAALIAFIAGIFMMSPIFKSKESHDEPIRKRDFFAYALPVFFTMTGFSLLSYMDVFMVKHFFDEHNAGLYSATSMIGKAFLFFPSAVVVTLFPKVSESHELNRETRSLLYKSLLLTAGISAVGIIICFFFPELIIRVMFGEKFLNITGIVRIFGMAIMPLVLLNVVMNYSLAVHRYFFIYVMYAGIALYAAALWFFHYSFYQVVAILFGVNLAILAGALLGLITKGGKEKQPDAV
jgi:O-antigen/teichoic acid export membrane protein